MNSLIPENFLMFPNYNENLNKKYILTNSDDEDYIKRNYETEKISNKNINKIELKSNLNEDINNDIIENINNKPKKKSAQININNNFHNSIPRSKKNNRPEIQAIDYLLRQIKDNNTNNKNSFLLENKIHLNSNNYNNTNYNINYDDTSLDIEDLENKKEILTQKLMKLKQRNKDLINYLVPYQSSMTNEDMEHEQRLKYIKYLEEKRKKYILFNNKLKFELKSKNISVKKKIQNVIVNQIKEYENIYFSLDIMNLKTNNNDVGLGMKINNLNNDYSWYKNTSIKETNNDFGGGDEECYGDDELKNNGNIYTNNNLPVKFELSLGGGGGTDYKLNNTTDGLNLSRPKTSSGNMNNIYNNNNSLKININNTSIKLNSNVTNNRSSGGIDKNKDKIVSSNDTNIGNNNSYKNSTSKKNHPNSIKFIKSTKIKRGSNTSSIISSHENNRKNEFKNLKQITKITSALNFGVK